MIINKSKVIVTTFIIILATPALAFDFGKIITDAVEKSVEDSVESIGNTITQEVDKALSSAMPSLGTEAKKDDGQSIDINKGIIIFGYNGCPHCRKAYAFLKKHNIHYTLMDTSKDTKASRIAQENGIRGVPALFVSGEKFYGFSEGGYTILFKKHGILN